MQQGRRPPDRLRLSFAVAIIVIVIVGENNRCGGSTCTHGHRDTVCRSLLYSWGHDLYFSPIDRESIDPDHITCTPQRTSWGARSGLT